jgi:hypothetical protein
MALLFCAETIAAQSAATAAKAKRMLAEVVYTRALGGDQV